MIEVPDAFAPRVVGFEPLASGFDVRNARGALAGRVVTPGGRFAITVDFPTMTSERALKLKALLIAAKGQGLRMAMPLGGEKQAGGAGVVNGSGAAGQSLPVRGLVPGCMIRQGYWLTVVDADGNHCLHSVAQPVRVADDGTATITVEFPLRTVLVDGDDVVLSRPVIEGLVTTDVNWSIPVGRRVEGLGFRLEEVEAGEVA